MEGNQYKIISIKETTSKDQELTNLYKKENLKMFGN